MRHVWAGAFTLLAACGLYSEPDEIEPFDWSTTKTGMLSAEVLDQDGQPMEGAIFAVFGDDYTGRRDLLGRGVVRADGSVEVRYALQTSHEKSLVMYVISEVWGFETVDSTSVQSFLDAPDDKLSISAGGA